MNIKERNLQIMKQKEDGLLVKDIANTFDLSRSRIDQIILHHETEKEIDKNSKELINRIKRSDNMDKKWPMYDLVNTLKLSTKATIRMVKYFSSKNKVEVSLKELTDSLTPIDLYSDFSLYNIPILIQKQLGRILYREMIDGLSKVDFGDTFNELWKKQRKVIYRQLGFK